MARAAPEDQRGRLGLDPEELRRKYREERDKRPRPDSKAQYLDVTGSFCRPAA